MKLNVVILAAGKGSRMKSELPKVLQPLAKKPLLSHVIDTSLEINADKVIVVYGHGGDLVKESIDAAYPQESFVWVEQREQLGTGHAVAQSLPELLPDSQTLILYGDVPLISVESLKAFIDESDENGCGVLAVNLEDPTGYGRIIRNDSYDVTAIVEEQDASDVQRQITEVNTGIMVVNSERLSEWLPALSNENSQGEYYLTDIVQMANDEKVRVHATVVQDPKEVEGVNDKRQLAMLERKYQRSIADRLMTDGVTLADPDRIEVRGNISVGTDTFIDVNCVFEGDVTIGKNVEIGPNCTLINCSVGDYTIIRPNCVLEESSVADSCDIGPFARLRPNSNLLSRSKVGNFVETKKSTIGVGSKVNHLSYVGDTEVGEGVNIGAGTITCNYDGANKHKTTIGDKAFIGSNTSLVAPVEIGEGATIGAGSTITKNAPDNQLTLTRAKQLSLDGWKRPTKK